jgi:hypothetical protein
MKSEQPEMAGKRPTPADRLDRAKLRRLCRDFLQEPVGAGSCRVDDRTCCARPIGVLAVRRLARRLNHSDERLKQCRASVGPQRPVLIEQRQLVVGHLFE